MPVKTSNSFHEKPEGFSPERRNVFKKLRRLLKQIPKGPATPSRASGTREKIVRSMSRNRAVVGAELCGRWSRIVRSFQANRAVDFFALTSQCEGIVRSIFPLPANPSEQAPARLRLPGEKPRRKSIKKEDASLRTHPPVSFTASVMQAIKLQQELQQLLQQELLLRLQQPQLQLWQQLQQLSFQLPSERLFHLLSFQLPDVPSQQPS